MRIKVLKATDEEFKKFQDFIMNRIGIKFPDTKRTLLESRLSNHIGRLGLSSFGEYYTLLMSGNQEEYDFFIDKITTHTTHFFRENFHFDFLKTTGLKILTRHFPGKNLNILSLGTSTGEEMYTLAMTLEGLLEKNLIKNYRIDGADISKHTLLKAKKGIFKLDHLNSIPKSCKKYFNITSTHIEAKDVLKKHLKFFMLNACKVGQKFPNQYHVVFCRNMLIYFSKDLQENVIRNIESVLLSGGLLFIGHSESLHNVPNRMNRIVPTIYQGVQHD